MPANPQRLRQRWGAWRAPRKQTTFVYCPGCRYELVAGGDWLGQDVTQPEVEAYKCARCGTISAWLFDAPAPILLRINGKSIFEKAADAR